MDDEITQARKNRIKKVRKRRRSFFFVALAVVLIAVVIANTVTKTTFLDIGDFFGSVFCASKSYPVALTGAMPTEVEQLSMAYAVLTDKELLVYSNRGANLLNYTHGFISPLMAANGNRIALYNVGGKDVNVFNRSKEIAKLKTDFTIISADISDAGTLAVLTRSDKYVSQLEVYENGKYDKLLTWYGSEGFPLFVRMQRGGARAAVVAVRSENGRLVSEVTAIDASSAKVLFSAKVNGLAEKLSYDSNGYITLVTDEQTSVITTSGEVKYTYSYGDAPILFAACDEGRSIALCFGDNHQAGINRLVVLSTSLKEQFLVETVGEVDDMYISRSGVYVLGKGVVSEYTMAGKLKYTYEANGGSIRIVECGKLLTVLPDSIEKAKRITEE